VKAQAVVVAAGALHTPALLLRSGLGNAHIGANLHLHPTTVIFSRFDEPMKGWHGAPMTRVSQQFANLDGRGYGVWLETSPVHPGMAAQAFPWHDGREHKRNMQQLAYFSNIIILARDYHGGRVTVGKDGAPRITYQLSPLDGRHLLKGLTEAIRIHHAAGARVIHGPHQQLSGSDGVPIDQFIEWVQRAGFAPNSIALFSAHQMSSSRIGGSSAIGAISPEGETYEVKNLFVADGSALPTAAGVNPMISIMALAHYVAQHIKARF
jgi:choline dehydrogenase-like flavoprotein